MSTYNIYISSIWKQVQKLFKSSGEGFLLVGKVLVVAMLVMGYGESKGQGQGNVEVSIGHGLPKGFWEKEHLFFINGDTVRKSLFEHKGKLLVLDFWSSGCAPCLLHQKKIKEYVDANLDKLVVVMINSTHTRDSYGKLVNLYKNGFFENFGIKHVESIIQDDYLLSIFPYTSFPHYVWINKSGRLQLRTFRNLLDKDYPAPFID